MAPRSRSSSAAALRPCPFRRHRDPAHGFLAGLQRCGMVGDRAQGPGGVDPRGPGVGPRRRTKSPGFWRSSRWAGWGLWRDPHATVRGVPVGGTGRGGGLLGAEPDAVVRPRALRRKGSGRASTAADTRLSRRTTLDRYIILRSWHHVFVMTVAVTPLGILTLAGAGAIAGLRRIDPLALPAQGLWRSSGRSCCFLARPPTTACAVHSRVPVPRLLAGFGLQRVWQSVRRSCPRPGPGARVRAGRRSLAWIHPFELAYYGEVVGGVRGAHRLGLETTYWMDAYTGPVLEWMNRELPRGARVNVFGNILALDFQQAYGEVRRDIAWVPLEQADWALVQMRQGFMLPGMVEFLRVAPGVRLSCRSPWSPSIG